MVLVDTSVWIRFLAGRAPHARALDDLLASDQVLSHELVQGELLIGDNARSRTRLLAAYSEIHRARTVSHAEVVEFVEARKLRGRGIGWVDAHLLASTLVERCTLWTADFRLADLAAELRVAHASSVAHFLHRATRERARARGAIASERGTRSDGRRLVEGTRQCERHRLREAAAGGRPEAAR